MLYSVTLCIFSLAFFSSIVERWSQQPKNEVEAKWIWKVHALETTENVVGGVNGAARTNIAKKLRWGGHCFTGTQWRQGGRACRKAGRQAGRQEAGSNVAAPHLCSARRGAALCAGLFQSTGRPG